MTSPPALIRPSQLARFWELHPRTLRIWIREGRLPAIRSPGNHFRVRLADVQAFCEREALPVPSFVSAPAPRVVIAAAPPSLLRALARTLKTAAVVHPFADAYEALVAAAAEPAQILAIGARQVHFDAVAAVRAFTKTPATSRVTVIAFDVPSRARALALEGAGAAYAIVTATTGERLPELLGELLGL